MEVIKRELVELDKVEFPETLYKYRSWEDVNHRKIITERQAFFAPPNSFDDPLDCKIPTRWDLLTKKEIKDKYLLHSKEINAGFSRQQHRAFSRKWTEEKQIWNVKNLQKWQIEAFEKHNERSGIFCLAEFPNNQTMWNAYSNCQTGFCVGFEPLTLFSSFQGAGGHVRYVDELPIIYPTPKHDYDTQNFLQVYTKLKKWEFEKEYRSYIFKETPLNDDTRIKTVPVEAYKEIIIGNNMPISMIDELIDHIPQELKHIKLRKACLINGNIQIVNWLD